jgi:hypothetical protein
MNPSSTRRLVAIVLGVLLVAGVAVGIFVAAGGGGKTVHMVSGLSGSEKIPFFQDARVVKRLHDLGFDLNVEAAGSREIATKFDLTKYDFAFPAGVPAAQEIKNRYKTLPPYSAFYTPMVVATFKPIVDILIANGIAHRDANGLAILDVKKYLAAVQNDVHWTQLKGSSAYPVDKSVIITSTDVRTSNSAAMYLSLASNVANGDNTVQSRAQANAIMPLMSQLFLRQGFVSATSEQPFDDYLTIGIGKSPMVMIYEAQFVARAATNDGSILPSMELMYPAPTVLSKHIFVPLTQLGDGLGKALTTDPKLLDLETQYGFRTATPGAFRTFTRSHHIRVEDTVINAVDPPSYETLEYMIGRIQQAYKNQDSATQPPPTSTTK